MPSIGFDSYLSISLPTNSKLNITNTLNIQAVFADNYAKNTAKAKEITAQISGIGPSIDDDPYSDYDDIATNSQKINYSIPTNVEAIYGNNHSMNYVQTDDISAILNRYGANASNAQWLHFHNVNNVNYAMSMPITVGAIHAENSTVNTIIADNINTDIGKYDNNSTINGLDLGDLQISFEDDNIPIYYTLPAGAKFSFSAPVTAFGAYATNNAINDITTNKINVTTFLMALPSKVASNSNESSVAFWNPNTSRNFSTNIFGLYASNDSLVNLHNNNGNPVEINVGIRDSDDDSSGHGYAHTYDRDDASTYGIYLDKSSANLYDSVIVKGHQVDSGFTALDKPAITHLKDSTFAFAGYEDYDDSYQLHGNHNGSHTFHTYDSSSDGELSLRGTNTFVVNTDILSKKADELFFATMDADSAGQQYISVAADKNMIGDEGKLRGTVPIIDIIDAANNLTTDINALTDVSGNITKYDGKRMIVNTPLRTYETTPYITTLTADNAHKQVVLTGLDYQMIKPADDMVDANDSQMIMRYMGWLQTDTLMQRLGDLRYDNHTENGIWTRLKKGEYEGEGSYNDSFSQKYNQITVGYDKESARKNGKVYTGFAISHLFGDTDYNDGDSGKAKDTALALYGTWGHYLDVVATAGRSYSRFDAYDDGNRISTDYSTARYGLSGEYGYRQQLKDGYFIEPQVQLTFDYLEGTDYSLSNGIRIHQGNVDSLLGRVGFIAGRDLKNGGNIYMKAAILSDLGGSGNLVGYYQNESLREDTIRNHTWTEVGLGANVKVSRNSNAYMDISKTFGGDVNQKWQFNAGMRWSF